LISKRPAVTVAATTAAILVLAACGSGSSGNDSNVTCKKQDHGRYELCIHGQPHPVIVPYYVYRAARVGGYYDTTTGKAYTSVNDDPHVNPPAGEGGGAHPVEVPPVEVHPVVVDGGR
jgi:hypothetical protein